MKKLVAILLLISLLCLTFAACTQPPVIDPETPTGDDGTGETGGTEADDGGDEETPLDNAVEYIRQLYKDTTVTSMDYSLITSVEVGDGTYTITWTVNTDKITVKANDDGTVTIDVPDQSAEEIAYVLTATVSDKDGNTKTYDFERNVPKFAVNTWNEYFAAEKDDALVIEGIVTGIVSKTKGASYNCLFLQDASVNGGYYVYGMADDPVDLGIEIGMTVRAAGAKDIYNGTHELKPNAVEITKEEKTAVTPIDVTEAYKAAADLQAKDLVDLQGALVTVKGVELADQPGNGYHNFILAGKTSYVRISSSTCAITKEEQTTFTETHEAKRGYLADVTGIVSVYNSNFYLVPVSVDAFANFVEIQRTDAEKVEYEAGNLEVDAEVHMNTTIDLPVVGATYSDVTISWISDNACAVVTNDKLAITLQAEAQTVKLTATITCGEETKTVEFTIAVDAKPTTVPAVVDTPVAGTAYKFMLTQSKLGKNLFLNGEMDGFYFATTDDFNTAIDVYVEASGDGFKLYTMDGEAKTYISIVAVTNEGKEHINVIYSTDEATVYTWDAENKTFTTEITGTTSKDGTYYFGTYDNYKTFSASKIDKMATSFVAHLVVMVDATDCAHSYAGDCDKVCDLCGDDTRETTEDCTYENACDNQCNVCNGTRTVPDHVYDSDCDKNCNVCNASRDVSDHADTNSDGKCDKCDIDMNHTCADADGNFKCDTCDETVLPAADSTLTIEQALALGALFKNDTTGKYTEAKYYVTGKIKEVYNPTYGNMYIVDANGTELTVYGTYSADGATRYDALTVKPVAGDTVTVYGVIGAFKQSPQMQNGWITAHTAHTHDFDDATCEAPKTCSICGATEGDKLDHADVDPVDGKCDTCDTPMSNVHTCVDDDMDFVCDVDGCDETVLPAADSTLTIEQALALGALFKNDTTGKYTEAKYYVTGKIKDVYNPTFGNMHIVDANGTELTVYGTYSADGATRYDALTVKPVAGDTVTVYGVIGAFKQSPQMQNGWITAHTAHEHDYADATCDAPETCSICGGTQGTKLDHIDVAPADGICDRADCGADLNAPVATSFYLASVGKDNTTYYFNGTYNSGKGAITTNAAEAAEIYKEEVTGGFYLYMLDGQTKQYMNIGTSSTALSFTTTPQVLVVNSNYNTIQASGDGRGLALYHNDSGTPTDIRTYACSSGNNFTKNTGFQLVEPN